MKTVPKTQLIYEMDAGNQPAARIRSGETVILETLDCFGNYFCQEQMEISGLPPSNPATGPVWVEGAAPGDALKITVLRIELGENGMLESVPGKGCLGDRVERTEYKKVPICEGRALYSEVYQPALRPMIGVLGVAPAREGISTLIPGDHGANMDCTDITEGAVVYLPVFTEGALLAAGDLHGLMGDGEIGYSGLETDGRVTLKVELVKGAALAGPMVINRGRLIVVASDDTLDAALVTASLRMCDFLVQRGGLPAADAVRLLTLLGDAGICQAVNPQKTAKLSIPVREFAALGLDHSCGISL